MREGVMASRYDFSAWREPVRAAL
jgi:hypothetical protein